MTKDIPEIEPKIQKKTAKIRKSKESNLSRRSKGPSPKNNKPTSSSKRSTNLTDDTISSSNLTEFLTDPLEQVTSTNNDEKVHSLDVVDLLKGTFPLMLSKEDITLDPATPIGECGDSYNRELSFNGKYKGVDVSCVCIVMLKNSGKHQDKYAYALEISEELTACRNMATFHDVLFAKINDMTPSYELNLPRNEVIVIVKPFYPNGTLGQFLESKRQTDTHIEPLQVLQMAITLFSMLSDAHSHQVGLVDISLDTLYVSADDRLHFDAFHSCVYLHDTIPTHQKPWMNLESLKCPELNDILHSTYKKSADVFSASLVMLHVIRKFNMKPEKELFTTNKILESVSVYKPAVDLRHEYLIEILEEGLKYDPNRRPSAAAILYWLESARYRSFAADI